MVLNRYLSDGLATTKSDVYAFGVVLFELISGKEAITRTEGKVLVNPERRSLVSIVSSITASFLPHLGYLCLSSIHSSNLVPCPSMIQITCILTGFWKCKRL